MAPIRTSFFLLISLWASLSAFAATGDVDLNFQSYPWPTSYYGDNYGIGNVVVASDGKAIIASDRGSPKKFNFDGSVDSAFQISMDENDRVGEMVVCGEKLYIATLRRLYFGGYDYVVSRHLSNGSLDGSFSPVVVGFNGNSYQGVSCLAATSDGGCIIGGGFTATSAGSVTNIARFKNDGSLDTVFATNAFSTSIRGGLRAVYSLSNGQILLSSVRRNEYPDNYGYCSVIRLNSNGTVDPSFHAEFHSSWWWPGDQASMTRFIELPDSSVLVAGSCNSYGRINQPGTVKCGSGVKLLPNGSLDPEFYLTLDIVFLPVAMAIQSDGKIILAANASTALMRLLPNGMRDPSFAPIPFTPALPPYINWHNGEIDRQPSTTALGLAIDPWDDIYVVGRFESLRGTPRKYSARISGGVGENVPNLAIQRVDDSGQMEITVSGSQNYFANNEKSSSDWQWTAFTNFVINGSSVFTAPNNLSNQFFRVTMLRP